MRIALVSREVAGVRGGGIGTYVSEAGYALRAAGHHVTLITDQPIPQDAADWSQRGCPFDVVLPTGERYPKRVCASDALGFSAAAFEILRSAEPAFDYAEFPDFGAAGFVSVQQQRLGGALPDTQLGVALHAPTRECLWSNGQEHLATTGERIVSAYEDETLRHAPLVWSPSARLRELVATRLGLDAERIPLLRYPMDFSAAGAGGAPLPPRPRESLVDLRYAFFGRIEARKGVPALVEAFRRMPKLQLELYGRDTPTSPRGTSLRAWLERDLPANVRCHDPLPRDAMLARLAEVDVCLLPSPWENWPNACLEAMGAARVVLGGRDGGMSEMIEPDRSGFLVDGTDPDDIVRVVGEELRAALPRLDAIGAAARDRVHELSDASVYARNLADILACRKEPRGDVEPSEPGALRVSVMVTWDGRDRAALDRSVASVAAAAGAGEGGVECRIVAPRELEPTSLPGGVSFQPAVRPGRAGLLEAALRTAPGDLAVLLSAGDRVQPGFAESLRGAALAAPASVLFLPQVAIDGAGRRAPELATPVPFQRELVWQRDPTLGVPLAVRVGPLAEAPPGVDPAVETLADFSVVLDLLRRGHRYEVVPTTLARVDVMAPHRAVEPGWQPLLAELAHLMVHHPLPGTPPEDAMTQAALVRGFGAGALLSPLGGRPWALIDSEPGETPTRLVSAAFAILRKLSKWPVASHALRALLRVAFRAHGRAKPD